MEFTTEECAKKLGINKDKAYGFLRFLESVDLAENLGSRRTEQQKGQKGKGPTFYRLNDDVKDKLCELLKKLTDKNT